MLIKLNFYAFHCYLNKTIFAKLLEIISREQGNNYNNNK